MAGLLSAARSAYGTGAAILATAGAQAAIQMIPRLHDRGVARVLSPTYNEHAASLRSAGWAVDCVTDLAQIEGADLGVVVNPNNPDGQYFAPECLVALAQRVGLLIVDESFADPRPEVSVAAQAGSHGIYVLRSFGKFYGLAGLRLGFVMGAADAIVALSEMAGPWPVSGAAIEIGRIALADRAWADATAQRLRQQCLVIDGLASRAGWSLVGGCELFRTYRTPDASSARDMLARHRIWSRAFPWSDRWLRLGLPGGPDEWDRLTRAIG
jgi:cobalamin biosynthetic protein CobC